MSGWKGAKEGAAEKTFDYKFNPITTTASELRPLLDNGTLTCLDLVHTYLYHISRYNGYLRGVLQTAPLSILESRAKALDAERAQDPSKCGPLHGIPILVKDNIATDFATTGLNTTCGSFALLHAKPKGNALLVETLTNAGAIILGKANLSEFAYLFGEGNPCGWSAVGGQTQSAYVKEGWRKGEPVGSHSNTGGSSSGSAVCVAAGFAPISIGTETSGSLIMPANRAALYTMKPTISLVSQDGIIPASDICDSAGPMTKNVTDFVDCLEATVDPKLRGKIPEGGFRGCMKGAEGWKGLRVGVLDPSVWKMGDELVGKDEKFVTQQRDAINAAYEKLKEYAAEVKSVELISIDEFKVDDENILFDMWKNNFRPLMDKYLSELESSPVRTLQEVTEFNKTYEHLELPPGINQDFLLSALSAPGWSPEHTEKALAHIRSVARTRGIDHTLSFNNIDVIIAPADSDIDEIISGSGYPVATLPLGTFTEGNGRPFGLVVCAGEWQEGLLVRVMSAWEETLGRGRKDADLAFVDAMRT